MTAVKRSTRAIAARAIADVSVGTILADAEIAAPPERVFRALTTPEELKQWWGSPDTYQITEAMMDLRVGGDWRTIGVSNDGTVFSVSGKFIEIDPPRRLVQSWTPDWDGGQPTLVRYLLEPIAGGTHVVVRHEGFGSRSQSCASHAQGWERVLDWLTDHLTDVGSKAVPEPLPGAFFLVRLLPPRPNFGFDMTPDERRFMQEHVVYWREMLAQGRAIVFGPVDDPARGGWGLGVVRARNEAEVRVYESNDPAIKSGSGFSYEVLPMLRAVFKE